MNAKSLLFPAALIALVAILGACNAKKSQPAAAINDTLTVEKATVPQDYLSQDLATFDLRGNVAQVIYDMGEHSLPVVAQFDADGKLTSLVRIIGEDDSEQAEWEVDDNERIAFISWEEDAPWVTILEYEDGAKLPTTYMSTNQMGNYISVTYHRDADGNLVSATYEEGIHGGTLDPEEHTFTFTDFDDMGNWQTCTNRSADYVTVTKRSIKYQ